MDYDKAACEYPDAFMDYLSKFLTEDRRRQFQEVLCKRTAHISVLTEYLYDEQNLHAIVRTAECLGIQHIHVVEQEKKLKPAKKISRGSHKWVTMHHYLYADSDAGELYESLRRSGYRLAAAEPGIGGYSPEDIPIEEPLIIMLGKERTGLSDTAKAAADYFLQIPMYGFTESYNVSVAAALCLFPIVQRLHRSGINWHLSEQEKNHLWRKWVLRSVRDPAKIFKRWQADNQIR
ncbi:MAG: RNA methyltransferase [Chitinophagales bacterium]|nr:RNA methyltransferase [Chitinophagales bacterium]MDW8418411.1 RNA methyltransferase [Chitinophagales bacterium]